MPPSARKNQKFIWISSVKLLDDPTIEEVCWNWVVSKDHHCEYHEIWWISLQAESTTKSKECWRFQHEKPPNCLFNYCWWFRNPKQPPGINKNLVNNGINYQAQLVNTEFLKHQQYPSPAYQVKLLPTNGLQDLGLFYHLLCCHK